MPRDMPFLILVSIVVLVIIFLSYSKYVVKTDLEVRILNQTSACYSGQTPASLAGWKNGNVVVSTSFETPDPCYRISSIKAVQQGDRIEVDIKTASGGVCVQCFGFKRSDYELISPKIEKSMDIYVHAEDTTEQHVEVVLE